MPSFMKRAKSAKIGAPRGLRAVTRNNKEEIMDMTRYIARVAVGNCPEK